MCEWDVEYGFTFSWYDGCAETTINNYYVLRAQSYRDPA